MKRLILLIGLITIKVDTAFPFLPSFFFFFFSVYLSLHPPKKTVSLWVWALTVPDLEMLCLVPYLSLDHASKASFSKTGHQAQRQLVAPELEPKLSRLSPFASLTLP